MANNKFDTRQSRNNAYLAMIANQANFNADEYNELDNLLSGINTELTPPFRLYPNDPTNMILNVAANVVTNSETSIRNSNQPINKQFPSFTSGTITLPLSTGGTILVSPTITPNPVLTISANAFIKGLVECDSLGNLSLTLGQEGATELLATFPGINSKAFQIGLLIIQTVAGVVQNVEATRIIQFRGGGAGSPSDSGGPKMPIPGYNWLEEDNFDTLGSLADSKVTYGGGYTNGVQDLGKDLYKLSCDKTRTVATSVGTALTINLAPTFTVVEGDIVYLTSGARINQWRRISAVISQTSFTLDAAFTGGDATLGDTLMLSQAVWSKDLVNFGSASELTRARDQFSGNITQIGIDYFDSLTTGDDVADYVSTARTVVSASNSGLLADVGVPLSNTFSPIFTRAAYPAQINDYTLAANANQERLHLAFFCNPNNGTVTTQANLLRYEASFYPETYVENGGKLFSAYCYTDGAGTEVNCNTPTVVSLRTRIQILRSYVPNVNAGSTAGQLTVYLNGLEIPRFVSGATTDAYYLEVQNPTTGVYDMIDLYADFSAFNYSVEIIISQGIVDTSDNTSSRISALSGLVVGTAQQVSDGLATFTSIQAAHDAADSQGYITVLNGTYTENVTISKEVTIQGRGRGSNLNGTLTFTGTADYCVINKMRVNGDVSFPAGADGIFFREIFMPVTATLTDLGAANSILVIVE